MPTRHVSFRLHSETFERLEELSRTTGRKKSELLNALVDEGLRMESHPGIVFATGPAGRRPRLIDGPDVWEVVRVVKNVEAKGDAAIPKAAAWMDLRADQVETAVEYYADHRTEIDAWIARVDREAQQSLDAWERRREAIA